MKLEFSFSRLLLIFVYFKYVKLVPDEYCLPPLNRSDCGIPPTPVFSYYKYGSRCEIEFWRGCPTENMFENEYHCSHYCIGRTRFYGRERGSWKGRDRNSIDEMTLSELEEMNGILQKINDSVTDETIERLINHQPGPRPRVPGNKTTVNNVTERYTINPHTATQRRAKKYENDKRREDDENEEDSREDDGDYVTREPVTATQMPLKHKHITTSEEIFLRVD